MAPPRVYGGAQFEFFFTDGDPQPPAEPHGKAVVPYLGPIQGGKDDIGHQHGDNKQHGGDGWDGADNGQKTDHGHPDGNAAREEDDSSV